MLQAVMKILNAFRYMDVISDTCLLYTSFITDPFFLLCIYAKLFALSGAAPRLIRSPGRSIHSYGLNR